MMFDHDPLGRDPLAPTQHNTDPRNWTKPSLAVIACDGDGNGCVLHTVGPHVTHELDEIGRALGDIGLDDAPEGISIWEGKIKTSGPDHDGEYDAWLDGTFREPTDDEWAAIRAGRCPWSEAGWLLRLPRYKAWAVKENTIEPGTLLLRTGSEEKGAFDVDFAGIEPEEVATLARERTGYAGIILVKDFDTGWRFLVDPAGESRLLGDLTVPNHGTVEQCGQCGAEILGYHVCQGVPGGFGDDDDPYEGSFREAADNEGARIAAESRADGDDS